MQGNIAVLLPLMNTPVDVGVDSTSGHLAFNVPPTTNVVLAALGMSHPNNTAR
jgi:hypothetical protein